MKTLCKSFFALAAAVLVSTTAAQAVPTIVNISGSTAYRSALYNSLATVLTAPTAVYTGNALLAGSSDSAWRGTIGATTYEVRCHMGGSVTGIVGLSAPATNHYNFMQWDASAAAVTPGTQTNFYSPYGLVAGAGGGTHLAATNTNLPTVNAASNCGFSDAFQATAAQVPGAATAVNASALIPVGGAGNEVVGILPFAFLKGAANTADGDIASYNNIVDITDNNAAQLFAANNASVQLLTGNIADSAAFVYAVGRDQDSGTRISQFAETQFGVGSTPGQYQVITSGGAALGPNAVVANLTLFANPVFPTIGGGYASGGNVATALECSGWDNSSLPNGNYGYGIGYLGAADTDTAITSGFQVTANTAFNGAANTFTAAGTTGANVTNTIAVGNQVYLVPVAGSQAIPTVAFGTVTAVNLGTKLVTLSAAPAAGNYAVLIDTLTGTGYLRPQFLTFNGVQLTKANVTNGKYQPWEYEHFFLPNGGVANALETAIYNDLTAGPNSAYVAGYKLGDMAPAGGAGTAQKSAEGKPIHF